jgi:GPH family glycoside/pentoside/hexuronide:cation symporter
MVPAVLFVPLWIVLARRIGKKPLWLASMVVMTFAFSALFLVGPGDWPLVAGLALVAGVGGGLGAVVAPSIQADIIDWDELRTGERKEGAYFAVWGLVRKAASGVTNGAAGIALGATGFVPNAAVQTPETLLALRALFGLFPGACFLVGTLLFLRFRFTHAEHARVMDALAARRVGRAEPPPAGLPLEMPGPSREANACR